MNVSFEDFKKLEIRIGKVLAAEKVEGTDKLLKLEVDFGPSTSSGSSRRQVVSGIAEFYKPEDLIGNQYPFVVNLESRTIKGIESQGMILAVGSEKQIVLLKPDKEVLSGSVVG